MVSILPVNEDNNNSSHYYLLQLHNIVGTPVPRTPFLLLKAPVSTLYQEKFGGDRNMFTGKNA